MGSRNVERDKPICAEHVKLAWFVKHYPDWIFDVNCRGCAHAARLDPERLLKRLGKTTRVGDVIARLKCAHCGCNISSIKPLFVGKRRD